MAILGKMAGVIVGFFAMSFLGIVSIFAPRYSDRLYDRMLEWADASD